MAGSVTAYITVEQTLLGNQPAKCLVAVSNNATGQPIIVSRIDLTPLPPTLPATIGGLQFGGGGGGAATAVSSVNTVVNSGSTGYWSFGVAAHANVQGNPTNVTVGGTVYLSDGTVVTITPAVITEYVPATATAGSGNEPLPVFMQSPGAALFASNLNSSLIPVLLY
jgi:hypothetical protein